MLTPDHYSGNTTTSLSIYSKNKNTKNEITKAYLFSRKTVDDIKNWSFPKNTHLKTKTSHQTRQGIHYIQSKSSTTSPIFHNFTTKNKINYPEIKQKQQTNFISLSAIFNHDNPDKHEKKNYKAVSEKAKKKKKTEPRQNYYKGDNTIQNIRE